MLNKVYKITVAFENEEEGYCANSYNQNISAESAEKAIKQVKLEDDEFIDGVELLCVIDLK